MTANDLPERITGTSMNDLSPAPSSAWTQAGVEHITPRTIADQHLLALYAHSCPTSPPSKLGSPPGRSGCDRPRNVAIRFKRLPVLSDDEERPVHRTEQRAQAIDELVRQLGKEFPPVGFRPRLQRYWCESSVAPPSLW
jgi:hypothetical protein